MSDWQACTLSDVLKFGNGKSRPKEYGTIPVYGGNGILDYTNSSNYQDETIVIGRVGAYCGATYYEDKQIWVSDNALSAKALNRNDAKFLYYFLKNLDLNQFAQGSSHPLLTQTLLNSIEVVVPSSPLEQKAIASVLSSLDDKIDLLHRQNKTLEAMAETLFRQWFIEEAKEDWEETPFTKWVYETKGGDWGKETPVDEFTQLVQCIRGTDIADLQNGLPKSTPIRYIKEKKFQSIKPEEGDIVFEISGGTETQSTGRCYFINEEIEQLFEHSLVFSNFCRLLKVRNPKYSYFVYLYLLYLYKADEFFALENGSSGIKNLNYKALLTELTYKMPPDDLVLKFHSKVSTYFSKVTKNKVQVQTLEKLRDTLLPKLMSGEVRVLYQTEEVA